MALAEAVIGLEQVDEALAFLEAPHEQDVQRPVAELIHRLGVRVKVDVDPVRDDPVVAREVAADKVARRPGDRNPALQLRRQLRRPALPDPVAGAESAEGVEGRHVHRLRLIEHGRRQEGNERLVEVQDVKPMLCEQLAGLLLESPAQRHATHAAVGWKGPACPQPDDVPLALSLLAVLAGDDPGVVPQPTQLFVLVADMVVDAARMRIAVGTDEGDLQRSRRSTGTRHERRVSPLSATPHRARSRDAGDAPWPPAGAGTHPRCATRSSAPQPVRAGQPPARPGSPAR